MEPTQNQTMKSLSPDGPGHDQASQGKDVHTIAKSSETNSEVTKADDDVSAPALAEKQKSTNDQQTTALTLFSRGKRIRCLRRRIYPSTSITTRKRHANPTHSVLVTNMTRHGWSQPLQPFEEPVSCLVSVKGAKQVSGWIMAVIWCNPQGVPSFSSQRRRSTEAPSGRLEDFAEEGRSSASPPERPKLWHCSRGRFLSVKFMARLPFTGPDGDQLYSRYKSRRSRKDELYCATVSCTSFLYS
eukprot:g31202.t1